MKQIKAKLSIVFIEACVLLNFLCEAQFQLNEDCTVFSSNNPGICRFADDCSLDQFIGDVDLLEQVIFPTICGYDGGKEIICCPESNKPKTNTIEPEPIPMTNRTFSKKCSEYQQSCPTESTKIANDDPKAVLGEFPFSAILGFANKSKPNTTFWMGSATLISENFLITVAHAFNLRQFTAKYVRLGDLDYKSDGDNAHARQFNILKIIKHPLYTKQSQYNDIALIKIAGRLDFNEYIRPACLSDLNTIVSEGIIVPGWGSTTDDHRRATFLQKIPLHLVSQEVCNENYKNNSSPLLHNGVDNKTQICAGSKPGEMDTCAGFSGAPLLNSHHKFSCMHEVVGLTSMGLGCRTGQPGLNTRISGYIDWIESIVWPEN